MTSAISWMNQTKAAASGDPYWSSVVLSVLNESGADGTTTFADQSASAHTMTGVGNFQWDTAQAPTGQTSSGLSDGTGDALKSADSNDWDFGAGDFTVDFFLRFAGVANAQLVGNANATPSGPWSIWYSTGGTSLRFFANGDFANRLDFSWSPSIDTWYHVELDRSGTSWYAFVNGTQIGSTLTYSVTLNTSTNELYICDAVPGAGGFSLNGWMCSLRITKGVARHIANFTPPTLPLPTS